MSVNLGIDRSGNNNHWTVNNMTLAADQMVDSPTNNFCTWNPLLETPATSGTVTFSEGNLSATTPVSGSGITISSMGATSGKYYAEILYSAQTNLRRLGVGITGDIQGTIDENTTIGTLSSGLDVLYYSDSGNKFTALGTPGAGASYGDTYSVGDIIGIALNIDDDEVTFYKNNTAQDSGTAISFTSGGTYHFAICDASAGAGGTGILNCGQDSSFAGNKTAQGNQDSGGIGDFYYTPPTGFLALCTSNLPAVAVVPSKHFGVQLYSHTNADQTVTLDGASSLDMVWVKSRSAGQNHRLIDIIRGKSISPNVTSSESNDAGSYAFSGNTFTIDNNTGDANENSATYVAWMWKANGSGSSNTTGSINSTVSANTDAGFSIVKWTGDTGVDTIGHGLSKAPELLLVKNTDSGSSNWIFWSKDLGTNKNLFLNSTNGEDTDAPYFFGDNSNMTVPTSTVFTIGNNSQINESGSDIIAYCFHSVDGYSKFGSYTGNANADGTFVYTGFRPMFVIGKCVSTGSEWKMYDSKRNTYNVMDEEIRADRSDGASVHSNNYLDFLSNGFKPRYTDHVNQAQTYIYLAFAETPFKYSNAR